MGPLLNDHALGTVGRARAAAIPDEVLGAPVRPAAVRVVLVAVRVAVQAVLNTLADAFIDVEVVAHWHTARLDDPWSLVLPFTGLVDEALGALSGPLVALLLLILRLLVFILIATLLLLVRGLLVLLVVVRLSILARLLLLVIFRKAGGPVALLVLLELVLAARLLLRRRHREVVRLGEVLVASALLGLLLRLSVLARRLLLSRALFVLLALFVIISARFGPPASQVWFVSHVRCCSCGGSGNDRSARCAWTSWLGWDDGVARSGDMLFSQAMVSEWLALELGHESRLLLGDVVVMDALAAADLREAFLALEVALDRRHGFPFELVFLVVTAVVLLPVVDLGLHVLKIELLSVGFVHSVVPIAQVVVDLRLRVAEIKVVHGLAFEPHERIQTEVLGMRHRCSYGQSAAKSRHRGNCGRHCLFIKLER